MNRNRRGISEWFKDLFESAVDSAPRANDTDTANLERLKIKNAEVNSDKQKFQNKYGPPTDYPELPVRDTPSPRSSFASPPVLNEPQPGTATTKNMSTVADLSPDISGLSKGALNTSPGYIDSITPVGTSKNSLGRPHPPTGTVIEAARLLRGYLQVSDPLSSSGDFKNDFKQLKDHCGLFIEQLTEAIVRVGPSTPHQQAFVKMKQDTAVILRQIDEYNTLGAGQSKEKHMALRRLETKLEQQLQIFIVMREPHTQTLLDQKPEDFNQCLLSIYQATLKTIKDEPNVETIDQADETEFNRRIESMTGRTPAQSVLLKGKVEYRGRTALGRGGMGTNYQAYRGKLNTGQTVAIKCHLIPFSNDNDGFETIQRILRQVELWVAFSSAYILPCYGIGMEMVKPKEQDVYDEFKFYLVSPFMGNGNATSFVSGRRRSGLHVKILQLIREVALGVQYLHRRDPIIVHAAIRGENVIITDNESACLNGFSFSKALSGKPTYFTGENELCRWMAPELFESEAELETSCDVWSWAMATLELISLKEPYFHRKRTYDIPNIVKSGQKPERTQYPTFDSYCPEPDLVWELMEQCWTFEAAKRPTIDEVVTELERIEKVHSEK